MSASTDALMGRVLGGTYRVERKLGEGGMGAVYAARNVRTGKPYAVKVLLPELSARREALARFEREARALAALGHVGIVEIHDFATESDGLAFLVMDQLEGEELGARIKRQGRLAPEHAVQIALEIASALAAAHSVGIVHRDLKPSNVFLARRPGGEERAVLLDFGLARSMHGGEEAGLGKVTASGVVMGTPHYMSPEQAQGTTVGARSDLYSLGAILFEMLSGRPPFEGPTLAMLFALLVTTPAPTLASLGVRVDPALDALVHACLEKDPTLRPAGASQLGAMLAAFPHRASAASAAPVSSRELAEGPTLRHEVPATRVSAEPAPAPRRWPVITAVLGSFTLVGAIAIGVVLDRARVRAPPPTGAPGHLTSAHAVDTNATDAGVDAFVEPIAVDAGHDAASEPIPRARSARASRDRETAATTSVAAPTTAPSGPPGVAPPPGFDRVQAAADRMAVSDFRGCLDELRSAPATAQVLGMRMSCANSAGDHAALASICATLHERFPEHGYTRTCDVLMR